MILGPTCTMVETEEVFNHDRKRCFRMLSMISEEGADILRLCLQRQLAGQSLSHVIHQPNTKQKLDMTLKKKILKRCQYDLLYPGPVDMAQLDVTLLSFLIRQLHANIPAQDPVWVNPLSTDHTIEADASRLRDIRNAWGHKGVYSMSEQEFLSESSNLADIMCRLAENIGDCNLTAVNMKERLDRKISAKFEFHASPLRTEMSTSTSSSLCIGEIETLGVDVATSTGSLEKRRKLSFRIRSYLQPFTASGRSTNVQQTRTLEIPKRSKRIRKDAVLNESSLCSCDILCRRKREPYAIYVGAGHSSNQLRCRIDGISFLQTRHMVLSDSTHNVIQVINLSGYVVDEFQCDTPLGICQYVNDSVLVVLGNQGAFLKLSADENMRLQPDEQWNLQCSKRHYDIKAHGTRVYVLCANGEFHIVDLQTKKHAGTIYTGIRFATCFDILVNAKGSRLFVLSNKTVACVDLLSGYIIWQYESKNVRAVTNDTFRGIAVYKNKLYVGMWDATSILELTITGKMAGQLCYGHVQYPWLLARCKDKLFISQYMSSMEESTCREIIVTQI